MKLMKPLEFGIFVIFLSVITRNNQRLIGVIHLQVYWVGPMCGGVAAALTYDFLLSPKFDDFPERMKVLVSGPVGDYDVNGGNDATAVEMTSK